MKHIYFYEKTSWSKNEDYSVFCQFLIQQANSQLGPEDWAGLGNTVWFDNGPKNNVVSGILRHIEDMQNIGQVTKKVGYDSVWFDSRMPYLQLERSQTTGKNYSEKDEFVVDMDPLVLKVDGNGLSPEVFQDTVKQVPLKDDDEKWRKSIESNEKVIIRI